MLEPKRLRVCPDDACFFVPDEGTKKGRAAHEYDINNTFSKPSTYVCADFGPGHLFYEQPSSFFSFIFSISRFVRSQSALTKYLRGFIIFKQTRFARQPPAYVSPIPRRQSAVAVKAQRRRCDSRSSAVRVTPTHRRGRKYCRSTKRTITSSPSPGEKNEGSEESAIYPFSLRTYRNCFATDSPLPCFFALW